MNRMKKHLIALMCVMLMAVGALCVTGCGAQANSSSASTGSGSDSASIESDTLIVYYSATGSTEAVADDIADYTGADVFVITPEQPYTEADLDYENADSRVSKEHDDVALRDVKLAQTTPDRWDEYENIILGYPIWWGEAAWPVASFVSSNDFTGKTIFPFCTSASSGIGDSADQLEGLGEAGSWMGGMRFPSGVNSDEVRQWIDDLGLEKQGLKDMD